MSNNISILIDSKGLLLTFRFCDVVQAMIVLDITA